MDALAAAGDAFARGEQLLAQTETDLDRAKGDSDATIADWATETAQNLARGQEMPPSPALDTNNVVEAEAKHRAATLAGQRLLLQQRASQASLATAEMRIQGAVIAVMQGDAALIAAELAECESKAAKLRTRLTTLPRLWLDNRAVKVSPEIVQLVRDRPPNADLSQPAILKSVSAWRSYAEELKLDPNAVSSLG